jgi:hypothetical protein
MCVWWATHTSMGAPGWVPMGPIVVCSPQSLFDKVSDELPHGGAALDASELNQGCGTRTSGAYREGPNRLDFAQPTPDQQDLQNCVSAFTTSGCCPPPPLSPRAWRRLRFEF